MKSYSRPVLFLICFFLYNSANAQVQTELSGQISLTGIYNTKNILSAAGRYIPQVKVCIPLNMSSNIDFEIAANSYQTISKLKSEETKFYGKVKPYRLWGRYYSEQFEIRGGIQKINFGSAILLRPLMWFDNIDPTDPLQLTDGVTAVLGRYYFLNNSNVWIWGIYPSNEEKSWETKITKKGTPEFGGRIQYPLLTGELGFSYHRRIIEDYDIQNPGTSSDITEQRFGIDWKLDYEVGIWFESAGYYKSRETISERNYLSAVIGADYTFSLGNGLNLVVEHLMVTTEFLKISDPRNSLTALSINYPLDILDNISGIIFYDWERKNEYLFVNLHRKYDNLSIHLIGYSVPGKSFLPAKESSESIFEGQGVQITFIFNH
ncbi:MAG: hypothetical protein GX452_07970 [Ignavibacteriales bacterium]|mgnify:CR=1 FL=1|nr:hypothetical protein [Ignavibacteriales bacterium]HPO55230.1 hypothetical protein [Ignavibacteriaceae bacterium]